MIGRNKAKLAIASIAVLVVIAVIMFFILKSNGDDSDSKPSKTTHSTTSTTKTQTSTSQPDQESTSTSLVLDGISISLSTPISNQKFKNETVPVRAIIEGTTSGTCKLKLSQKGSDDIELEAPVIAAPSYFTCQGFDVNPDQFQNKGEWTLELSVKSPDGKSGSETRKITLS